MYGRMSDMFELKKLYRFAVAVLAAGSLVCALAPNLPDLVVGRMVQGVGMAAIPVLSVVTISKLVPPGKRGGAFGIITGSIGVGTAGGPIFGGAVGQLWGWPSLFWVTFVLSALIAVGAHFALPTVEPEPGAGQRKFDWIGGTLHGLAVGLLSFGVTLGERKGSARFSR